MTFNGVEAFPLRKGHCECDLIWKYVVIKALLKQGEAEAHHNYPSQKRGVGKGVMENGHPERNPGGCQESSQSDLSQGVLAGTQSRDPSQTSEGRLPCQQLTVDMTAYDRSKLH